jgi:lantibiotic modifying enzyme
MKNDLYKTIEKCSSVQCIDSQMHVFCYPIYQVLRTKINSSLANANIAIDSSILSDLIFQSHNHIIDTVLYKVLEYEYQIAIKYEFISASEKQVIFLESAEMKAISNDLEWWFYILNKYKALGPMISKKIDNISAYICFVISKYITDSTALEEMCKCKLKLYSIKLFKGDLHHNRCVTAFLFNEGETICYLKPRNAENESFLIEFIDIINSLGANIVLGIPQFIDYREYSWHLNVNKSQMKNNQSIDSYYYNLGKILCVFYIMHSQDIIPDNIISHQGVPYIIDYECIFAKYSTSTYDIIQTEYMNSVMSTGILPTWMLSDMQSRNRISSVLFPFGENSSHLPIKNGEAKSINVKLLAYFIDGFKTLYSLMEHNSQYILGRLESAIKLHKNINSRIILHPTSLYVLLLNEAIIPETLANDKQLNKLAQKLALDSLPKELNRNIVNSILKSIKEGSVPAFYIKSAEIGIFDSFDNNLGNYYHYSIEDGIENLRTRMKKLSALDLRLQTAIIEDSVRAFMHTMYPLKNRTININKCVFDRLKLLVAAKSIADKIKERIFSINNTVGLVCKTRSSIDGRYQALPLSSNIYDGDCGVLIFFEMLYKYTGDLSYKHISEGIFCRVKSYTEYSINLSEYRNINLSPMTGIMGIIYVMELFPERYYEYKTYNAVIKYVTDNLRFARSYDFLTGIIGIMSFVINASFIEQSDKIRLINRCVKILNKTKHSKTDGSIYWEYIDRLNHLSNNALELGGFAHGSASAAAVLYQDMC